ncbi:MAG: glycine betaine/L-proline ABC transporter ATP-binding protein [Eubacteriales bacterium]|jgi:glycine betaine/proline transport system ATP-binding protein|nr:glycine betaine/L-proline ABC transporter ATP-binding protein [Eubacteriales bacterium]NCC81601.1 glycine betaine/L-proline ABC transporter ATP-binding protein [Clostridia bacterium]
MGEVKIKVQNLTKIFGNKPEQGIELLKQGLSKNEIMDKTGLAVGVNNASFEVEEGQFLVIMGLSGSGKSTLVRLVNRLIEPTSGSVIIDGNDITKMTADELRNLRRKKFAMVFQRFALFPHRTILKNVEFGLEIQGMEQSEREQKAREALDLVGLKGWEDSYPEHLSGGMQQRVGLARALAVDPDILLMDEAFSALDPLIKKEMQDELLALQNRVNKTIIFITHDLDEALKLGDKIILMKDGAIVQEGTPEDILTNPADEYVEKFVEDVNTSKILTASGVMKKVKNVAYTKDGPRTVLRKMEEEGISSIFVVNRDWTINGIVFAEDAAEAAENGVKEITNIIKKDVIQIGPDTPVSEIFPVIATATYPIVVADENKKLLGIIIKGTILAKLAGKGAK